MPATKQSGLFGIVSARDFLGKANRDAERLRDQIENPDLAINAILSAYHLREWVWAQFLKQRSPITLRRTLVRRRDDWFDWCDAELPHAQLLKELANGSKHCSPIDPTDAVSGYGRGPFGVGPFGKPYLLIDLGDQLPPNRRYLTAHEVVDAAMSFWNELAIELAV